MDIKVQVENKSGFRFIMKMMRLYRPQSKEYDVKWHLYHFGHKILYIYLRKILQREGFGEKKIQYV